MIISSWNIRGFNDPIKQQEVRGYLSTNKIEVFGLLETRVKYNNSAAISKRFASFSVLNNYSHHYNGRIWVFLNPSLVTIISSKVHDQLIHLELLHHISNKVVHVTFVYGSNDGDDRKALWDELRQLHNTATNWILMGDFNIVRDIEERVGPNPPSLSEIMDFNQCLLDCQLEDTHSFGCEYTWTNKRDVDERIWSKLDRVLVNPGWLATYPNTQVTILPSGISDHSPLLIQVVENYKITKRFRYLNYWEDYPDYDTIVQNAWKIPVRGNAMFRLFSRLKNVRHSLQSLHRTHFAGLNKRVQEAKKELEDSLLGKKVETIGMDPSLLRGSQVPDSEWPDLCKPVEEMEIKRALFSIDSNKSPGHDGFSAQFFKKSRPMIKHDYCCAIQHFFRTGVMSKQANTTLLALIPKKQTVSTVMDYRPIA
ncbi:uncharacterized protein LOC141613588 [Silene latifolia]|uniref:uncharacterized protein LOC141613588 n=1 Tax=Silene latifolia TaxID=37657 RepID=UPI003D77907A